MLLRDFPGELIVIVGANLKRRDLLSLMLVNRRFTSLLRSRLRSLALEHPTHRTALYWAIISNDRELAKLILEKGHNVTVVKHDNILKLFRGAQSKGPLMEVIHHAPGPCDDAKLDWIMSQGVDVFIQSGRCRQYPPLAGKIPLGLNASCTPFAWSIKRHSHVLLRLALGKSGGLSARMKLDLPAALEYAAEHGGEKVVEILLQYGADPDGYEHYTRPLHMAAVKNHVGIARRLLEHGANVEAKNYGTTAFATAEAEGHKELAGLLLEHSIRANPLFKDYRERPAIYLATKYQNEALVKHILEKEFDFYINDTDGRGNAALHIAALNGNTAIAKLLLENGAAVNNITPTETALHMAANIGDEAMVRLLLDKGANINLRSTHYLRTALHLAATNGCLDVVKVLLEKGADVNVQDSYGWTALHLATRTLQVEITELLRKGGALLTLKDSRGMTPTDLMGGRFSHQVEGLNVGFD